MYAQNFVLNFLFYGGRSIYTWVQKCISEELSAIAMSLSQSRLQLWVWLRSLEDGLIFNLVFFLFWYFCYLLRHGRITRLHGARLPDSLIECPPGLKTKFTKNRKWPGSWKRHLLKRKKGDHVHHMQPSGFCRSIRPTKKRKMTQTFFDSPV
jgi:hypothetical protein